MPYHFTLICLMLLSIAACSDKTPLPLEEKARYTVELIDGRSDCKIYSEKLSSTTTKDQAVNDVYQAAKAAHCLKPSV